MMLVKDGAVTYCFRMISEGVSRLEAGGYDQEAHPMSRVQMRPRYLDSRGAICSLTVVTLLF